MSEFFDSELQLSEPENLACINDAIYSMVAAALPNLSKEKVTAVTELILKEEPVELNDLKFLKEEDFHSELTKLQARKLTSFIAQHLSEKNCTTYLPSEVQLPQPVKGTTCVEQNDETSNMAILPSAGSAAEIQVAQQLENWANRFEIPYGKFPNHIIKKCQDGQRPDPGERLHIIRILCYEIAKICKRPGTKNLEIIASKLVSDYTSAFRDEIGGKQFGNGYVSLLKSLVVRFDNMNRVNGNSLKRQVVHQQGPKMKKIANVQPDNFPEKETKKTQEERKCWLQTEYTKKEFNYKEAQNAMFLTFTSQRLSINSCAPIDVLIKGWPFLQDVNFLLQHFNQLMAPYVADWDTIFKRKIPEVRSFLKTKFNTDEADEMKDTLSLLLNYFKESNELFKVYEEFLSADDVEKDETCPVTPFMAFFGQTDNAMLFIERKRVSRYLSKTELFKMWFASFYVYNIEYPVMCPSTMCFIQRALLGITTKSREDRKKDKTLKLINELCNFKSVWNVQ